MRQTEESALKEFTDAGWSALRNGWPDYLLVRLASNGQLEFMALEVKCPQDELSGVQRAMHVALLAAGIKVEVRKVVIAKKAQARRNSQELSE